MKKSTLLIFASGAKDGGGSGFQKLAEASREGVLNADIVGVVSNHERGGVWKRAKTLGIPCYFFPAPWSAERYRMFATESGAEVFALSGWLKRVEGLPPERTINIHPGPLPLFGGQGMYGHHVHGAVIAAFGKGEITHTEICMHFVNGEYDRGPIFFRLRIPLRADDTPDSLAARVNALEHAWQPRITNLVVSGEIILNSGHLVLPSGYSVEHHAD